MPRRSYPLRQCRILKVGGYRDTLNVINKPEHLGATMQSKLAKDTTHVVVSETKWKAKDVVVQEALRLRNEEGCNLKIVSFSWLQACCASSMKKKEDDHLWEKLDRGSAGGSAGPSKAKKRRLDDGGASNDGRRATKSAKGMLVDVFNESTEPFVDASERRALGKKIAKEKEVRRQMDEAEEEEREREDRYRNEKMALFINGTKKAKAEIFSGNSETTSQSGNNSVQNADQVLLTENHHIYVDGTNFPFDIVITRVDSKQNRNERIAITIYESNSLPHSYAVNSKTGTAQRSTNELLCGLGCSFAAAFRAFKNYFRDMTGSDWDSRISDHLDRQARGKNSLVFPYEQTKFRYFPPKYAPFGVLSPRDQIRLDEIAERKKVEEELARIEEGDDFNGGGGGGSGGVDEEWFNGFMSECFEEAQAAPTSSEAPSMTPAQPLSETECDTAFDNFTYEPSTFF